MGFIGGWRVGRGYKGGVKGGGIWVEGLIVVKGVGGGLRVVVVWIGYGMSRK